jgi:NitT/TauT family transport system permease protein
MTTSIKKILLPAITTIIIVTVWQTIVWLHLAPSFFVPSPSAVLNALFKLASSGKLASGIGISFFRIIAGFIIATLLGIPCGMLLGLNKNAAHFLEPIIDFVRYTPISAFIPLMILWLGIGEVEKIMVIFISVFFQLVLMTANTVARVPEEIIQSGQTLGAGKWYIISHVIFPYSIPFFVDDLRVNFGWAWTNLILAEIVGSTSGLGYIIIQSQRLLQTANVMAAISVVGIIGLLSDYAIKKLHAFAFEWI